MTTTSRSPVPGFALTGVLLVITVATGLGWLGQPFRLVHLVTIIGLGMATGVFWMQAMSRVRGFRGDKPDAPAA